MRNIKQDVKVASVRKNTLENFILSVFNYMGLGLVVSAIVSFVSIQTGFVQNFLYAVNNGVASPSILGWLVMFSPLIFLFIIGSKISQMNADKAKLMFFAFAGLMGISLGMTLIGYSTVSIVRAFLITASTFGAMSIYGWTTKKDLTSMGSFLIMGLIGVIIASIVNMFLKSGGFSFILDLLILGIFIGLTAWDVQKLKRIHGQMASSDKLENIAVFGALSLYLDFINMFLAILSLTGRRD